VLEVMMKREDYDDFLTKIRVIDNPCLFLSRFIDDYIMKPGKLALAAITWMEENP
jgi:hypothetical protein